MKLTVATIGKVKLEADEKERFVWDDDVGGFGLRLREGGSRTWVFQFKIGLKHRRMSLGSATAIPVADARETAAQLHALVKQGKDPAGMKIENQARAVETFEAVYPEFLQHQRTRTRKNGTAGLKPRSLEEATRHLETHCKPLHGLRLDAVDQPQVAALLTTVAKVNGPIASNRVRSTLSAFFNWSMRAGKMRIAVNPAAFTNRSEEHKRDRVLAPHELRSIWDALPPAGDAYGDIVRLLMLTGQRRDEIGAVCWSEMTKDNAILLPPERTKNSRPHLVPLSASARKIPEARPRIAKRDLVFGKGEGGFSGWSSCKKRLDKAIAKARKEAGLQPMKPWVLHDLRRTMDTLMHESKKDGGLAIAPHIVEAVINHISGHKADVAGVNNWATYASEKRDALNRWGAHLMAIVEGRGKVVTLRPAG
jgi:integrase